MNIKVASWNVEGRLSNNDTKSRSTPDQIIGFIQKINADIIVLPEAHNHKTLDELLAANKFKSMGYRLYSTPYEDDMSSRKDAFHKRLSILLLSKLPIKKIWTIRLANFRNAVMAVVQDPKSGKNLRVIGVHLDDRGERMRVNQIADLNKIINSSKLPTIVMGDFNAMHGEDLWPARFLRTKIIRFLAKFIFPTIAIRATNMATGKALELLEEQTNLVDADPKHRPTTTPRIRKLWFLPSIRLIQIDHIFVSPQIKIDEFKIAPDNRSDHRAISADIDL